MLPLTRQLTHPRQDNVRAFCPLQTSRFISSIEREINQRGLTVECMTDFTELNRECDLIDDKLGATEPFSNLFFDIVPSQGFWIRGTDPEGRLSHVQAMRLDNLEGISLADHWAQQLRRIHCDPNPGARLSGGGAPAAHMITGRVVYHGEMWIAQHMRGRGLGGYLSRLALGLAQARWAPDFVYGFVKTDLVRAGFAVREGYMHMQPEGIAWDQAPSNINADDWIVWMGREHLTYLVQQVPAFVQRAPVQMRLHS